MHENEDPILARKALDVLGLSDDLLGCEQICRGESEDVVEQNLADLLVRELASAMEGRRREEAGQGRRVEALANALKRTTEECQDGKYQIERSTVPGHRRSTTGIVQRFALILGGRARANARGRRIGARCADHGGLVVDHCFDRLRGHKTSRQKDGAVRLASMLVTCGPAG
ncbi:hypothetical protein GF068_00195 [Polyangium spumosum]|uniref:Uncharacterized protein n=1 Tax=Polyangium spumosum TaxID=889282 RepID=A0A6N7PN84_9BACT|nr:hypothetical protein [Polyangium spumosum]